MFLLFVSFDFSPKRAKKLKNTSLLNKFITGGPLLMNHHVKENSLKLVKRADLIHENPRYCLCNSSAFRFVVNVDDM